MIGDYSRHIGAALGIGSFVFLLSLPVHATVYGWKSKGRVLNLSNDLEDVPEAQRATAIVFISKLATNGVPKETRTPSPSPKADQTNAYERGLERGLQTAERQVALAGELARTVLASVPPAPPVRIVIQQPPQMIVRYVAPDYDVPFSGFIGPYTPYSPYYNSGYAYGFSRGRFVPHSHFFPGTRGRRRGLFFPHGHFSRDGFLFGHGFVVR